MARGRFISNSISESRKFAAVATDQARLAYLMIIPHVDSEGRLEADPTYLRGAVFMRLNTTREEIKASLEELHRAGLITLYLVDGVPVLEVADFLKHNKPHHKELPSRFPPPPPDSREAREKPMTVQAWAKHESSMRQGSPKGEVEVKDKEEVEVKTNTSTQLAVVERQPVAQARRASVDYREFIDLYNENRGALPEAQSINGKRKRGLKELVKEHGYHEALALFADATRSVAADDFWVERRYGFDNLLVTGRVVEKAEKIRDQRSTGFSGADARLARNAREIFEAIGGGT